MKKLNTLVISGILMGLMTTANATVANKEKVALAEKQMVIPVETVIEKLKEKQGRIETYTPIDSLVDVHTSKVFDSKSHNLKVQTLKSVIDHIDKTYLYQTNVTHTEVKSYPTFSALKNHYLFSATFNNGDKLVYTILPKSDITKIGMSDVTLERTFMTEGVVSAFSHIGKKPGSYKVSQLDTVNVINGFELIDLTADEKDFRVVFKHNTEAEYEVLFAMIKKKN